MSISLRGSDELIAVKKTSGDDLVLLGSTSGKLVKFNENDIRQMGRTASGVKGIDLGEDNCVCAEIVSDEDKIIMVTVNGYGKQTKVSEFRLTKRGSKGVKGLNITDKNGTIASIKVIEENKDLLIMSSSGITIRTKLDQINTLGRATQGVKLINLKDNSTVSTISLVDCVEEDNSSVNTEEAANINTEN